MSGSIFGANSIVCGQVSVAKTRLKGGSLVIAVDLDGNGSYNGEEDIVITVKKKGAFGLGDDSATITTNGKTFSGGRDTADIIDAARNLLERGRCSDGGDNVLAIAQNLRDQLVPPPPPPPTPREPSAEAGCYYVCRQ